MKLIVNAGAGLLFGFGLIASGLINPANVLNFLDLAGAFDPSLAITMATAVTVTATGYRLAFKRQRPVLADRFHVPAASAVDLRLVSGAILFGTGWGLAGFCPGPAVAAASAGSAAALTFLAAMLGAMALTRWLTTQFRTPGSIAAKT